ncbi:MAG: helix-turn-helix domain-containing protein [Coriobacteriales bacterium]|nr:helix-turn-helix domain-containing protein [Coriobacteriales bacterium]
MAAGMQPVSLFYRCKNNIARVDWRGLLNWRLFGFALNRAWVYLLFIGVASSTVTWNGQAVPGIVFTVSSVALFCLLFLFAAFSKEFSLFVTKPSLFWIGPFLTVAGTVLVATTTLPGVPQLLLALIADITTGIGSGIITMGYGLLYKNVQPQHTCLETPLAVFIAALIFFLASDLTSSVASCIVTLLLPLASGIMLYFGLFKQNPDQAFDIEEQSGASSAQGLVVRVSICAGLVGTADGTVRSVFMAASGVGAFEFYHVPLVLASLITLVLMWGCLLLSKDFSGRGIYKATIFMMALFFQLLPVFLGTSFEHVLALAGYGTFNALIWILLAVIAHNYAISPFKVFGMGWGMITFGVFAGSLIGDFLCSFFAPFSPQLLSLVALVSTLIVLLSYMFVLKESDIVPQASDAPTVDTASIAAVEIPVTGASQMQDIAEGFSASTMPSTSPQANDESVIDLEAADTPDLLSQETLPFDPDIKPRFINRCKEVAQKYGLSERETQIMILYAKGRSYTRIQEELFISRGTLTTHLRHIYQKMEVHNKQEFLDLIEQRSDDAE